MGVQNGPLAAVAAALAYEFRVYKGKDGGFFFSYRNVQGNTEPICWSETYASKQGCMDAIQKVKVGAAAAKIVDLA